MTKRGFISSMAAMLGVSTAPKAQNSPSLVGRWEVRHGQLGHIFMFSANGAYMYQRYTAMLPGAAPQVVGDTRGTYTVQNNELILRPSQGNQQVLRWRFGTNPTLLPGERALFLTWPDGREEMFYSG
jgi:hypothetical protein